MSTSGLPSSGLTRFDLNPLKTSIAVLKEDVTSLGVSAADYLNYKNTNDGNIININSDITGLTTELNSIQGDVYLLNLLFDKVDQEVKVSSSPNFQDVYLARSPSSVKDSLNSLDSSVSSHGTSISGLATSVGNINTSITALNARSSVAGNGNITVTTSSGTTTITLATAISIASAVLSGNLQCAKLGVGVSPTSDIHISKNVNGEVGEYLKNTNSAGYTIFRIGNDSAYDFVFFKNGSTRSSDGGVNAATLRNDNGDLIISAKNAGGTITPGMTFDTITAGGKISTNVPVSTPKVLTNNITTGISGVDTTVVSNQTDSVLYNHACIGTSAPDRSGAIKMISNVLNYHNGTSWVPTGVTPTVNVWGGLLIFRNVGGTLTSTLTGTLKTVLGATEDILAYDTYYFIGMPNDGRDYVFTASVNQSFINTPLPVVVADNNHAVGSPTNFIRLRFFEPGTTSTMALTNMISTDGKYLAISIVCTKLV